MKKLIVIVGPTAVGKTSFAIAIAKRYNCEIISCDSRQFYKELNIGTAKPSKEELAEAPHHFINSHSISDIYTAFDFEIDAIVKIEELHQNSDYVVMVGGSGLFVKGVCEGFDDLPDVDLNIREKIYQEIEGRGLQTLLDDLKTYDLESFNAIDTNNVQRVVRAVEVYRNTGKPFSSFKTDIVKERKFSTVKIGLEMDRVVLYNRIDARMDIMLAAGLQKEVESLQSYKGVNPLKTVGYKEIFAFLDGEYDWVECVRLLKRNSRRYAKRQLTWFKKNQDVKWIDMENKNSVDLAISLIESK